MKPDPAATPGAAPGVASGAAPAAISGAVSSATPGTIPARGPGAPARTSARTPPGTPSDAASGAERFAARFPVVWHVIEAEGLRAARRFGLLSAADLRALAGAPACGANRDDFAALALPGGDPAVLRFQQMRDDALLPSLRGAYAGRPDLWRAMLDRRVFFWADPARCRAFVRATRRERARSPGTPSRAEPVVLAFDTAALLRAHAARAAYSTFNTGSTVRGGKRAPRDEHSFRPVAQYRGERAAELVVEGGIEPALLPPG